MLNLPQMYFGIVLAFLFQLTWSQQLSGSQMYMGYPGLSTSCTTALNTNVSCPIFLSPLSVNGGILGSDQVNALCNNTCYSSLQSARGTIQKACTATTDVIVYKNVAYPATFIVDNFIYTYNVSCRKDSKTGQFCDPQFLAWSNQTFLNKSQTCSDCWLGVRALQLSNPLGYDPSLASNLASLTSACSSTGYSFASPTSYALNSTSTTVPTAVTATPPSSCTGSYTVQATDDCNSVAKALNVSTYNLLYENNLDLYCSNFAAAVNRTLCVPPQCTTYTWQASDSCNSVTANLAGVTVPQFQSWNPNFNLLCQNSLNYVGYQICLSPPGGYLLNVTSPGGNSNPNVTNQATVPAPYPTNALNASNKNCGDWYTVQSGDNCGLVSTKNYISLSDFYFLNPEINSNCTNLELGVAYCVEAVGAISTYPGYTATGTPIITVTPASYSSVNTAIPSSSSNPGYVATTSLLPKASGTVSGCKTYRNYDSTNGLNACSYVAYAYDVTTDQLLSWNPSLSSNSSTCSFQSGYSYCVSQTNATLGPAPGSNCIPVNSTQPGTVANCNCFTEVHGYQNATGPKCASIASDALITVSQLTTWNTWLSSNCDTALYANLAYEGIRAVCIGVNASAPTGTASTVTTTTTTGTGSMGPTQTGIVTGCQQYYTVQSGDSCSKIEGQYAITFAQFYSWNPAVGSNCQSLWVGYAYCVQGPAAASTTTTTTSTAPAPTQSGTATNCTAYYTVANGDSCSKIETQFNITFAQLYKWNPAIGSNCQSLWVGYAVCVAAPS